MRLLDFSLLLALAVTAVLGAPNTVARAQDQDVKSAAPAKELAALLQARKLENFAAQMPGTPDEFVGVLAFTGQLMVVWARTTAPAILREKLLRKDYRDAYIDLNSATILETRHFVTDIGADGLRPRPENRGGPADIHDVGNTSLRFDGEWREKKMSEAEYMKAHAAADAAYANALNALLAELKKQS